MSCCNVLWSIDRTCARRLRRCQRGVARGEIGSAPQRLIFIRQMRGLGSRKTPRIPRGGRDVFSHVEQACLHGVLPGSDDFFQLFRLIVCGSRPNQRLHGAALTVQYYTLRLTFCMAVSGSSPGSCISIQVAARERDSKRAAWCQTSMKTSLTKSSTLASFPTIRSRNRNTRVL